MSKIRVALLFGGKSAEHEVSLQSAKNIYESIDRDKYDILLIGIDQEGKWHLNDAERFLLNELERFKQGFAVVSEKLEKHLQGHVEINERSILIKGYADRVDRIDGRLFVIDYKTTVPDKRTYAIGDTFVEFQLPMYAMLVSKGDLSRVAGMAYYGLSRKILVREVVERSSVPAYLTAFRDGILVPTITELLDPEIPFSRNEDEDVCVFCSFKDICGVSDAG